jgi:hypothetical protein
MRNGGERARRRSGCARCRRSTQAAGRPQPAMPPLAGHSRESTGTPFGFRGLAHNVKLHRRNDGGTFLAFPPVDSELASTSSPVATRFAVLVTGRVVRVLRCVSPCLRPPRWHGRGSPQASGQGRTAGRWAVVTHNFGLCLAAEMRRAQGDRRAVAGHDRMREKLRSITGPVDRLPRPRTWSWLGRFSPGYFHAHRLTPAHLSADRAHR